MTPRTSVFRKGRRHDFRWLKGLVLATACGALLAPAASAKVETWRQEGSSAFSKGKRQGVVLSDSGELRLARSVVSLGSISATRVWDLARAKNGTLYAATGDAGKVLRREPGDKSPWTVALDADDSQALSLAVLPSGQVFVGTGPTGQVIDVTDPKHPASRPDPKVQYIWDLAADSRGNLFAATGPTGQIWKRGGDGKWSLVYDSKVSHILCLAVGPDDSVYAGTDGEGLIYKIQSDGKTSILYDAPQAEVRSLLVAPDGSLYAGTAAEAGSGGSSGRSSPLFSSLSNGPMDRATPDPLFHSRSIRLVQDSGRDSTKPGLNRPAPPGGSASPKPVSPGDNAVYLLNAEGVAREVFRAKALIFSLAWANDQLYVGTGPDGQLYEVRVGAHETVPLTKLDSSQILSLLADPDGSLILGTGDPGSIVRLAAGFATSGTLTSEVHDAKLLSRFGSLSWRGDFPKGTSVTVQARTGNSGEPDETWSAWSTGQTSPEPSVPSVPPGRFAQYRITLATRDARLSPEVRGLSLSFRSANLAPEVNRLEIPDVTSGDGATRQTRLNVRWDVSDPNDDDLQYTLEFRKEGWPEWVKLGGDVPITEKTYAWDVTTVPSGTYRLRLIASDRASNRPEEVANRERTSNPFIIDHDPPAIQIEPQGPSKAIVTLTDRLTRLVKADYAIDGGPWIPIFPDDGLFDGPRERITVTPADLKPGTHLLMIRATDAAGNVGSADALLDSKK